MAKSTGRQTKSVKQEIVHADERIVRKATLHSISIKIEPVGKGNPNKFRLYLDGAFIRHGEKVQGEDVREFIDNKMTSDRPDAEIQRCELFAFKNGKKSPTHTQIVQAIFSDEARKNFKKWEADCIFKLSGERTGYLKNKKGGVK